MYFVYIIRCSGNSLYTGITTDISRRFAEHSSQGAKGAKFTRSHKALSVEAVWTADGRSSASKLEYKLKTLTHSQKEDLIAGRSDLASLFGITSGYARTCP